MPDVDLFVRSSGEQRTSNFLVWQAAYAEMVFSTRCGRTSIGGTFGTRVRSYAARERRYGGVPRSETVRWG